MVTLAGLPVNSLRSLPNAPAGAKRTSIPISLMSAVRAGAFHGGGDQAALADDAEQRHAVGIVGRAQEIVHQARDEDGLAGAAQAGHREPDRRAAGKLAEVEPLGRLGEDRRQPAQIHDGRHLTSAPSPWVPSISAFTRVHSPASRALTPVFAGYGQASTPLRTRCCAGPAAPPEVGLK